MFFETVHAKCSEVILGLSSCLNQASGVTTIKRSVPLIVSLTSTPSRLKKLHLCIEALLLQSLKPDYIFLWLDEKTIGDRVPKNLRLQQARGLSIRYCQEIGSYQKIIYTLKENASAIIVTADDDLRYPEDWLMGLYQAYQEEPQYIHCYRAHLMLKESARQMKKYLNWVEGAPGVQGPSLWLLPTGCGGVIYPPGALNTEVFNAEVFLKISPTSDDIWFKAMSLLNGVKCKKVFQDSKHWPCITGTQKDALWRFNLRTGLNDEAIKAIFDRYNLYSRLDG